ncbi:MAG: M20/M25/M40 family metallo-hydrolase [Monoglobales bacterium]
MKITDVLSEIGRLYDNYIKVWEDVCNIESPSDYKKGVDEVSSYFIKIAEEKGWLVERFEQERFGDVVTITMNPDVKEAPVTFSGHLDTVHPIGLFGNPPTRLDESNLYGPGAMDCKGGVVAGFLAMDALGSAGFSGRPVRMILQSNEEVGSGIKNKATINYICEKAKDSVAFLNLEGYGEKFAGKACLIRKGIACFKFTVTGIEAHSSSCATTGANAIAEAAYKIVEIEKLKDSEAVTCSCNTISGGTVRNTVPGKCEFEVDVRFSTDEQYRDICVKLQKIADTVYVPGCSCDMVQTNNRCSMELNERNINLLNKANELFEKCGLTKLEIGKRTGGSDAADVSAYGIPCLDSIGVEGERGHSVEEYGVIKSLKESAQRLAAIVVGI